MLVVDFVNGFADPQLLGGGNIRDAIAATAPLLAFFRERKLPVMFARIVYAEDGSDAGLWCEKAPRLRLLTESADASQVVSELAPRAGEFMVRKTQASAFFGTHLGSVLTGRAIEIMAALWSHTESVLEAPNQGSASQISPGNVLPTAECRHQVLSAVAKYCNERLRSSAR